MKTASVVVQPKPESRDVLVFFEGRMFDLGTVDVRELRGPFRAQMEARPQIGAHFSGWWGDCPAELLGHHLGFGTETIERLRIAEINARFSGRGAFITPEYDRRKLTADDLCRIREL